MLDMLGMIAEPNEVPAARKIDQLEPRFVWHRHHKRAIGQRYKAPHRSIRVKEMFEHLKCDRHVKPFGIEFAIEHIGADKLLRWPA